MTTVTIPQTQPISKALTDLFGKQVQVKRLTGASPIAPQSVYVRYTANTGEKIVCVVEIALACSAGAALSMIPPGVAAESAKKNQVADNLMENFREVMNVLSTVWTGGGHRFALGDITVGPQPADVGPLVQKPGQRHDLEIAIPGYVAGKMVVVA